jgi:hypothetical protein
MLKLVVPLNGEMIQNPPAPPSAALKLKEERPEDSPREPKPSRQPNVNCQLTAYGSM